MQLLKLFQSVWFTASDLVLTLDRLHTAGGSNFSKRIQWWWQIMVLSCMQWLYDVSSDLFTYRTNRGSVIHISNFCIVEQKWLILNTIKHFRDAAHPHRCFTCVWAGLVETFSPWPVILFFQTMTKGGNVTRQITEQGWIFFQSVGETVLMRQTALHLGYDCFVSVFKFWILWLSM